MRRNKRTAVVAGWLVVTPVLTAAPVPKEKPREGWLAVWNNGEPVLLSPDGKVAHDLKHENWREVKFGSLHPSPNGFPVVAVVRTGSIEIGRSHYPTCELWLIQDPKKPGGEKLVIEGEALTGRLIWSRTGGRFYVECHPPLDEMKATHAKHGFEGQGKYLAFDLSTRKATDASVPAGHYLIGERPGGSLITNGTLVRRMKGAPKGPLPETKEENLFEVSADGKRVEELKACPGDLILSDLSPDGRSIIGHRYQSESDTERLVIFDLKSGDQQTLDVPEFADRSTHLSSVRWSPDGKRIAFTYNHPKQPITSKGGYILYVCDADGKSGREVYRWGQGWLSKFDWK